MDASRLDLYLKKAGRMMDDLEEAVRENERLEKDNNDLKQQLQKMTDELEEATQKLESYHEIVNSMS